MFVCGQNAYSYLPPYCRGSCYVAYVGPALDIVTLEHLKGNATIRSKRDLFHQNFKVLLDITDIITKYGVTVVLDEIRDLVKPSTL